MQCDVCNEKLSYTTECEGIMYCRQCKKFVGECKENEQLLCKNCHSEISFSTDNSITVCKKCGQVHQVEEKEDQPEEEKSYPSIMEQAGNLLHESVEFTKSGFQTVNEDKFNRRIDICRACPAFDAGQGRCKECGCFMKVKAKMETAKCPLNKWEE